ncbi:MAG: response regulator transcription factor [Candidatus Melainabacteria bacterium]|jgi:DNA-binding response OmpR family regulator|nr:response regulator transcription factor [Candidatus Melainabacteria bacterium]
MSKILLVEDDELVLEAVADTLETNNYLVEKVRDGQEAADRLKLYSYDLAILDIGLPKMSGFDVCRNYRSAGGITPILMLTGKGEIEDRVTGLDMGADDYLPKPFHMRELLARVKSLLRRPRELTGDVLSVRDVTLNPATGKATRDGVEIDLLAKELALLEFLMRHKDQIFSVDDLLDKVWHSESDSSEDAVRQCVTRVRRKMDVDGKPSIITTVKGMGYKVDSSLS